MGTVCSKPRSLGRFGGKSRVADLVWERFGDVDNYVEPFFGSGAVLLGAPKIPRTETINDKDGFVANFWRSISKDPEATAHHADWPVNEADLHARHTWLVSRRADFTAHLMGDPDYYDAMIAGWWVWGLCSWIGSGWCAGVGPWFSVDGRLTKLDRSDGSKRQRPHLGNQGQGINRKLPHLGDQGRGILEWFEQLATRLRRTRVCCGDWSRVCGPSVTTKLGVTAVFLDPPYDMEIRDKGCYATDGEGISADVQKWALEHGDDPMMRIALCGYEGEHEMPGWDAVAWNAHGGYGAGRGGRGESNASIERIWFSPACLDSRQASLF